MAVGRFQDCLRYGLSWAPQEETDLSEAAKGNCCSIRAHVGAEPRMAHEGIGNAIVIGSRDWVSIIKVAGASGH